MKIFTGCGPAGVILDPSFFFSHVIKLGWDLGSSYHVSVNFKHSHSPRRATVDTHAASWHAVCIHLIKTKRSAQLCSGPPDTLFFTAVLNSLFFFLLITLRRWKPKSPYRALLYSDYSEFPSSHTDEAGGFTLSSGCPWPASETMTSRCSADSLFSEYCARLWPAARDGLTVENVWRCNEEDGRESHSSFM